MTVASPTACLLALAEQIFSAAPQLSAGGSNPASAAAPASPRFPDLLEGLFTSDEPAASDPEQPEPPAETGTPIRPTGLGTALLSVVLAPTPPSAAPAVATPDETPSLKTDPSPAAGEATPPAELPATVPGGLPAPKVSAAPGAIAPAGSLPGTPDPFLVPADSNVGEPPAVHPLPQEPKQLPASSETGDVPIVPESALPRPDRLSTATVPDPALRPLHDPSPATVTEPALPSLGSPSTATVIEAALPSLGSPSTATVTEAALPPLYIPSAVTVPGQALRQLETPLSTPVSSPRDPQLPPDPVPQQQAPEDAPALEPVPPEVKPLQAVSLTPQAENAVLQPASPHGAELPSHPTVAAAEHRSLRRTFQNRFTPPAPELNFGREPATGNPDQPMPSATASTLETANPQQPITSGAVPQRREDSRLAAGQRRSVSAVQPQSPHNPARWKIASASEVPTLDPTSALVSPLKPAAPDEDLAALPSADYEDHSTAAPRNAVPTRAGVQPASNINLSGVPSQWTPPLASAPVEIPSQPERPSRAVSDTKPSPIDAQSRPAAMGAPVPDVPTAPSDIAPPPPQLRAPAPLAVAGRLVPIESRDRFFSATALNSESVTVTHTAQSVSRVRSFQPVEALKPTVESVPRAPAAIRRDQPTPERLTPAATRHEAAAGERTPSEETSDTPDAGHSRQRDVEAASVRIQESAPQSQPVRTDAANALTPAEPSTERPAVRDRVPAQPLERPTPTEPAALPDAPKAPLSARNIRLEMAAGEQRVEVQMIERAGNVHMAVRTPDPHLSGALRENLPDLSARLEQTGYRAESWHTPADPRRDAETVRGSEPNQQSQPDGRRRDDSQAQPDDFEQPRNRKQKGNEFEWFMASLRG